MKLCAVALFAAVAVAPLARATEATPVQKVIELMEGMLGKGKADKKAEQVDHAAFVQFCEDTKVETERHIEEANNKIERLKADIEEFKANAERLQKEIDIHDADIAAWDGDMEAATKVRKIEKAAYDELHRDYSESISALGRAIEVLKKQAADRPQASLEQLAASKLVPEDARKQIMAFLEVGVEPGQSPSPSPMVDPFTAPDAPDAMGYESHSHPIIEMLEGLLDKFTAERTETEKAELNDVNEYELLMKDLTAQTKNAKEARDEKQAARTKNLEDAAAAQKEVDETTKLRDEDTKYLENLVATCARKEDQFQDRQQLRTEELVALQKAIEIIRSEEVKGNAEEYLPAAALLAKPTSLAVLRSEKSQAKAVKQQVVSFLRRQADKTGSRVLSLLATRVEADPFGKVKQLIKDLIVRLEEEAAEEADHKAWCDEELGVNEQTRKEKTAQVEILHANVDELETSIARLSEEVAKLTEAIAALDKAMAEATELRLKEKAKNEETIADAVQAQEAVARALVILKEFYDKAAEATALVQQDPRNPKIPEMYKDPYKGMGSEAGGVLGMLEVIESDFARLEADTTAAEAQAKKEYDEFMAESKADKEAKELEIENKNFKIQDQEQSLIVNKKNLAGTQKELDASLLYFDKLKPPCIEAGVSYDERVLRRKEEIESLQQALDILGGEDLGSPRVSLPTLNVEPTPVTEGPPPPPPATTTPPPATTEDDLVKPQL